MNSKFLIVLIVILLLVQIAEPLSICFSCNSNEDELCVNAPRENKLESCPDPNDTCGVIINGTDTIRGCSQLIGKGDDNATPCNGILCNKQIYPTKRLRCHQCEDCVTLSETTLLACQYYSASDKCYTDVINEKKIFRGCLSDKLANLTEFVQKCNESGCNNQTEIFETLNCIKCESENDANCIKIDADPACKITKTKECSVTTLLGRPKKASCFTSIKGDKVMRGCTEKETNSDPTELFCSEFDYCNDNCVKPIKCLQCTSSDPKCETPTELTSQLCKNDIYCSACASNEGNITRACGFRNQGTCSSCQNSDACNSQNFCYKCSSDTNQNCATWKNLSGIKLEICENANEVCVAELINNAVVQRGCKLSKQCTTPNCKQCSDKDKCNIAPFPESIRRCIQCSGPECENEQPKADSDVCDVFDPNDSCYAYADEKGVAHRGCTSKANDYRKCNETGNCWTCNTNSCNTPKLQKCYFCLSNITENCGKWNDPSSIETITCQNPNQICVTIVRGDKVERGCKFPDAFNCEVGDTCKNCSDKANCNSGPVQTKPLRCLKCSGKDACDKKQEKADATLCDNNEAHCYLYANGNGNVFRGCSNDPEFNNCQKESAERCWTCNKDGCNDMKMPRCYICSSGLNENCATAEDINNITSQFCQNPFDHCVSRLVNKTIVQRECQPPAESDPNCGLNSENCKTCEGTDNCNLDPIPRKEFSCIECSGTDACKNGISPDSKTCSTYEACYIHRNASGNVFRGCISAPEDFTKCATDSESHCWTCKGDECNKEKLQKCYTCESGIDENCATFKNAKLIPSETCYYPEQVCAAVRAGDRVQRGCIVPELLKCKPGDPMCRSCNKDNCNDGSLATYPAKCIKCSGTQDCVNELDPKKASYCEKNVEGETCYAYADKEGNIFRGCVSNEEKYAKCQNSTNGHCWKCNGDGCNNLTFSHCLSCQSPTDENCATLSNLNSISSKVCQIPTQHCISQIAKNIVERGCYSNTDLPVSCVFNSRNCKTCDKDDCNTEPMPRKQIECAQCLGTEDCQNEQDPTNAEKCSTYESCYVSRNELGKTNRGCISKVEDFTICKNDGNGFCWTCNSTTCNTAKVRSCYTCKSDVNGNCGTWNKPPLIKPQTCQNPDEICATITSGKMVVRKCEKPEKVHCETSDATCQKCETDNCNNGKVHENPKRCHRCSGSDNCRLEQVQGNDLPCDVYGQSDACYVYTDENGQVFRGCMSSKDEYENCKKAGDGKCWTCAADGCNKDKILECFTCTSVEDLNCAIWNGTNGIASKMCKNPDELCVSYMNDGQTVRECKVPDEMCSPYNGTCQNCKEDKCNAGTIPKVELKCYKCSNTDDCQEAQNNTNLDRCAPTEIYPACWAYSDINGKMIRGCTGDKAGFKKCTDSGICRVCNSDGCNKFPYRSTPSLQCHKCSDSEACGWGQTRDTISPCTNKIAYYLRESCVTRRSDKNFERGCSSDLGICEGNTEFCEVCNTTSACNNGNIITQSCVQCRSTTEPKCAGTAESIGGKECPAAFTTYNDRGCYTRVTDMKGIVDRGCSQGLSAVDLSACKADKDHTFCEYCDGQDCNNKKAPNSAPVSVGLTTGFIILNILISVIF